MHILLFLAAHIQLLTSIVAFLGGEPLIILIAILSGQGFVPFWQLIIFSLLGVMAADTLWFCVGKIIHKIRSKRLIRLQKRIVKKIGKSPTKILVYSKFTFGIRIAAILLLGHSKMKFKKFILLDFITSLFLVILISSIGWLFGIGFIHLNTTSLKKTVFLILISTLVFFLLLKRIMFFFYRRFSNNKILKQ